MGWDIERNKRGLMTVESRNVLGETKENHETSVMIAAVFAEIRTEHFPNINLVLYCYTIGPIGPERVKLKKLH
jgi:hypothetical protein